MNKKGSMELSVNSIVILVIAIVMLGLILGFVRSKFSQLDNKIGIDEPDAPTASASQTFTMSRNQITVNPGEELGLKFGVYADTNISSDTLIRFVCGATNWIKPGAIGTTGKNITEGNSGTYSAVLKVPGSAAKGKQVCVVSLGENRTLDVIVEVK
jgi:hypothetical protein